MTADGLSVYLYASLMAELFGWLVVVGFVPLVVCVWAVNQLLNEDTAVFYTPYYPYGNLRLGKVPLRPVRGEGRGTERVRQKRAVTHLVMATLT